MATRGARAVAVLLLAGALLPATLSAEGPATKLRPIVRPGEKAAPFSLLDLDGKRREYRPANGSPSLLVFWSAFCPLCRELACPLQTAMGRDGKGVRLVWVNLDGKRFTNAVRSFAREIPLEGPVLLDEIRDDYFVACDPYGIEKTPTAILVGKDGRVRKVYVAEEMRALVRDLPREAASLCREKGPGKPQDARRAP